ncbi:hypothetical protein HPB51_006351 [Rhipicephalus microplus]|uniref:Uncharacterized protein n=1 Tax=Rhipicephalus microplus TaxID=6941 RepID=A0A9J6DLY2_RHIMP|nr:hypothetical protein HPB51_006351 [Rhipicephalus microplus]
MPSGQTSAGATCFGVRSLIAKAFLAVNHQFNTGGAYRDRHFTLPAPVWLYAAKGRATPGKLRSSNGSDCATRAPCFSVDEFFCLSEQNKADGPSSSELHATSLAAAAAAGSSSARRGEEESPVLDEAVSVAPPHHLVTSRCTVTRCPLAPRRRSPGALPSRQGNAAAALLTRPSPLYTQSLHQAKSVQHVNPTCTGQGLYPELAPWPSSPSWS